MVPACRWHRAHGVLQGAGFGVLIGISLTRLTLEVAKWMQLIPIAVAALLFAAAVIVSFRIRKEARSAASPSDDAEEHASSKEG